MKEYVGHKTYDYLLVQLLDEIASYKLREELLTFFADALFKISSCDMIIVLDSYHQGEISTYSQLQLFNIWDKNLDRNLLTNMKEHMQSHANNIDINFSKLNEIKSSGDAISYNTTISNLQFLNGIIPPSEFKKEGWASIVYLPRATPKHPERYIILWYEGYDIKKIPDTLNQDERVLYLFSHYYKLASFNVKNKAKLIYEQRMEMLKALVPSMISHEIYHRIVTLYLAIEDTKQSIQAIKKASTLKEAQKENALIQEIMELEISPLVASLDDITGAISKLTKQAATEEIGIVTILEQVKYIIGADASRRGINIIIDSPHTIIKTDRALLMHLIMNLISNSIEAYTNIDISPKIINIKVDNTDETALVIYVSDNAKGIPPNIVDNLFEEGFTTKKDGNGLGLSICHFISGFLGGSIGLEKHKSYKTTFKITLPRDGFKMTTLKEEL